MKKISILIFFLILSAPLFSLDIWINGVFHSSYSREELKDYAVPDNPLREGAVMVSNIIPLFNDVYRVEAYGGKNSIILEEPDDLLDSLSLIFSKDTFYLSRGDYRFENPSRLDIWGTPSEETSLMVIYPEGDLFTRERLSDFCRFHDLDFIPVPSLRPARELMNRFNQKKEIPHLVIFPEESYPDLRDRIDKPGDYYFTITSLFSEKGLNKKPMELSQILAETSHTYCWNSYDYRTFSLFENYYGTLPGNRGAPSRQALILNRSLKEMGILQVNSEPYRTDTDFFIADTGDFPITGFTCYPDFIQPLYNFTLLAYPRKTYSSPAAAAAGEYLLSNSVQSIMGWQKNGRYPALNFKSFVNPSDPCLLLLNKYGEQGLRLSYSDEQLIRIDNWQTLSRLALNSSLSIDDLVISSIRDEEGEY